MAEQRSPVIATRVEGLVGSRWRGFERDASAAARTQGGSLDLHEDSGQLALDRCDLTREFEFT